MPDLTSAALRERLERELPGTVVPQPEPQAEEEPAEAATEKKKPAKGAEEKVVLPAPTSDAIVQAERIRDVATFMRDTLGYALLSDVTAVDYLEAGLFEVVYIFYHPDGGGHLIIKVRVPRDKPDVPSLTPIWPGAELTERECYDLFGVNFVGHPYPKRIYLWDEFEGHPMRKDFPKQGDKYLAEN